MRDNSNLPPLHLLKALRQPRRHQLHDECVRQLFRQWKRLGRPIEYGDLNDVAEFIAPGVRPNARTREKIVAAVEAAGIKIRNFDGLRRWIGTGVHVSLTGEAMVAMAEEWRWRRPHEYDNRPPPPKPPEWMQEMLLDREYGPRVERQREFQTPVLRAGAQGEPTARSLQAPWHFSKAGSTQERAPPLDVSGSAISANV